MPLLSALTAPIHPLHLLHTCFSASRLHTVTFPHITARSPASLLSLKLSQFLLTALNVSHDSFWQRPLKSRVPLFLADRCWRLSTPHNFPSFQPCPAGGFVSLQRRCTTSQWASTYLIPRWFVARPGGQSPTSAGSTREWLWTTRWEESLTMGQRCTWPRSRSVATSPARSATSWATVLPPTQQVLETTSLGRLLLLDYR